MSNVHFIDAETTHLEQGFHSQLIEREGGPKNGFLIRFANVAVQGAQLKTVYVKAVLIYDGPKQVDVTGSWLDESGDESGFEPDSRRHKLIAGLVTTGTLNAVTRTRIHIRRRTFYEQELIPVSGFKDGTLRIQLLDKGEVLWEGTFWLTLDPPSIERRFDNLSP